MSPVRIAITGASGQLGRQLMRVLSAEGHEVMGASRAELDITSSTALDVLRAWHPEVVINSAAWTDVDGIARDPERGIAVNGKAAGDVAVAGAAVGALSVQISTNEVFDGAASVPYREDDRPRPINPYGASKLAGEQATAAGNPQHLIIRTAWIFGPGGRNFPSKITEAARREESVGRPIRVVADEVGNPTWAPDLAIGIWQAVQARLQGRSQVSILHVAGEPPTSRYGWAERILSQMPRVTLTPISTADYQRPAPVPLRAVLSTELARSIGITPSDWQAATVAYVTQLLTGVAP